MHAIYQIGALLEQKNSGKNFCGTLQLEFCHLHPESQSASICTPQQGSLGFALVFLAHKARPGLA